MSTSRDKLQQLLDGDLSAEDIADDPALVTLADRLYGIKITPARPKKARDMVDAPAAKLTEVAPPTDMLIEVIGDIAPAAQSTPGPLPPGELPAIPPLPDGKGPSKAPLFGLGALLLLVVANVFGLLSSAMGSGCLESDLCPSDGYTKMNLASPHELGNGLGWSLPFPDGALGIPDIVAVIGLLVAMVVVWRRS